MQRRSARIHRPSNELRHGVILGAYLLRAGFEREKAGKCQKTESIKACRPSQSTPFGWGNAVKLTVIN